MIQNYLSFPCLEILENSKSTRGKLLAATVLNKARIRMTQDYLCPSNNFRKLQFISC